MKTEKLDITRNDFVTLIDKNHYKIGIEIGVAQGNFSKYILSNSSIEILYLVDPFLTGTHDHYCTVDITTKNLIKFADRHIILPMKSEDAISHIQDNFVDFIYIDGDHRREAVEKDLEIWYPKLKIGGIFSGHDYHPSQPDVVEAVDNFCEKYNIEILNITSLSNQSEDISGKEGGAPSWFFYKK